MIKMFSKFAYICLLCTAMSALAQSNSSEPNDTNGEVRYVIDDLETFMHAGPGRNYRILGSIIAGTRLTLLQVDTENEFVEVLDDRQRTGWVESRFITKQQTIRELLPNIRERLQTANQTVSEQQQKNQLLNQQIAEMASQNAQLKRQLSNLQSEFNNIEQELATKDQTAQMEWFTRGGIIVVISILLGVLLTYLPKKRRRNDNWM